MKSTFINSFAIRLLSKPLFIAIFVGVFLSSLVFFVDHSTMKTKAFAKSKEIFYYIESAVFNQ